MNETKYTIYDIRRRHHGELFESFVIQEMTDLGIFEPITHWDGLIRPLKWQPYFVSKNGSSECYLDEFGWVADEQRTEMRSCILEVKAMAHLDWLDWKDDYKLHLDKLHQRDRHLNIVKQYGFDGLAFIAYNKNDNRILVRVCDGDGTELTSYTT